MDTKILEKEKKINSLTSSLEKKYEKEITDYEEDLTNKYQLPQKSKELLNSKANQILTKTQIENNSIKEEILNVLKEYKRPLKISELQEYNNYLANISSQKISALLNELVSLNKIKKVVNMKKSYFTLKD